MTTRVRATRLATTAADYAFMHRDSPIALACANIGAVRVVDNLRADIAHAVGTRELRRAYGLGVCSASHGTPPDVHQRESGLWPSLTPADYLAQWISTACQWADKPPASVNPDAEEEYETARLAELDQLAAELVTIGPVWFVDWLERLVHLPKWYHLVEMGAHAWLSGPTPRPIVEPWGDKMGRQWARRYESTEIVTRVTHELREVEEF